jgi:hypothetical protein
MSIEAMKQAVRVMGLIGADLICEVAHHEKKDRHELGEPCPVKQRFHEAFETLRTAIEQAEQGQWDAIPDAFNEWWDADYDDSTNPFRLNSPAYWAWSGWSAANKEKNR